MTLNPIRIIKYQIYLLQLENYELMRYLQLSYHNYFPKNAKTRKEIDWTKKLILITGLSFLLYLLSVSTFIFIIFTKKELNLFLASLIVLFISFILLYLIRFYLIFGTLLVLPADIYLKKKIINKAKRKISIYKNLKIIGISGSYGKTTMKECLYTVLSQKYKVLKTPENINTTIGISKQIIDELDEEIQIYIVEMGEYKKGDIADICLITKPDIAIITGISEAHFERMGSIENAISTMFEVVENSQKNALIVLNEDNSLIMDNYKKFIKGKEVKFYSSNNSKLSELQVSDNEFMQDGSGYNFSISGKNSNLKLDNLKVSILGEYILGIISACLIIFDELGGDQNTFASLIEKIKPIEHRLQPIQGNGNILIIDDSYNGNPDGVSEAIKVLDRFKVRRKVFITPGLVETGEKSEEVHTQIGHKLSKVADLVILIKNSVSPYIEKGLMEGEFDNANIIWFNTSQEAHSSLGKILKPGDIILFQNDWTENYI